MIEWCLQQFASLRADKARNRYPAFTFHRAPHKPILLLPVMDLIAQGTISENDIEHSFELIDTFNQYWPQLMPSALRTKWISHRPLPLNTTFKNDSKSVSL